MFRDRSLVPAEAIRLTALGLLAEGPWRYGDLAAAVRHFTGRIVGPSLDLMGSSLELLRYEGLAAADPGDDPVLRLTPAGHSALAELLRAGLRAPVNDLAKLGLVLKLRFLHHLPEAEQVEQIDLVVRAYEQELARLEDLGASEGTAPTLFRDWLAHDIGEVKARIAWLSRRRPAIGG